VASAVLHAIGAAVALWAIGPARPLETAVVDIEVAPLAPTPEALPPERPAPPASPVPDLTASQPPPDPEGTPSREPEEAPADAAVDAAPDAAPDARPDARPKPDAGVDAAPDAGSDGGPEASSDAAVDASEQTVAAGSSAEGAREISTAGGAAAPAGRGSALDTLALAAELAAGSAVAAGPAGEPAVDGAPTTAGTASNLLSYFPDGHVVTAMIRFDRLRGTEWAAQAERLLQPLPDYRGLFGSHDARIIDKLETLVISTPRPRDAAATTLVARTLLPRAALREFLAQTAPVSWSVARGGLIGKRAGVGAPGDRRVLLSPFQRWFVLAQPGDLGALTATAKGNPDTAEATAALPPWLAGIRAIEAETGEPRGPAVVVTVGLRGQRLELGSFDLGLGLTSIPTPDRASIAMELVPQGWLLRGNLRFTSEADAIELVAAVQQAQQRIAGSYLLQLAIGKRFARVIGSLAFARNTARVSYAAAMSIADARAILAAAGKHLDQYFGRAP